MKALSLVILLFALPDFRFKPKKPLIHPDYLLSDYSYLSEKYKKTYCTLDEKTIQDDSIYIQDLLRAQQGGIDSILNYINAHFYDSTNLGFGYKMFYSSRSRTNITVDYSVIKQAGVPKTIVLTPDITRHPAVNKRYIKFCRHFFRIDSAGTYAKYLGIEDACTPLFSVGPISQLNDDLLFLMSPTCGTTYGFGGGISNRTFTNRRLYVGNYGKINPRICRLLLYSKNPATRFIAMEYYTNHRREFKDSVTINQWVEEVFHEVPVIGTMSGCVSYLDSSRTLVAQFSNYTKP